MPDISSIDAVLNPAKHNYMYMTCGVSQNLGFMNLQALFHNTIEMLLSIIDG